MGVVARDAIELAIAFEVTPRQAEADRLEPRQHRVATPHFGGTGPVRGDGGTRRRNAKVRQRTSGPDQTGARAELPGAIRRAAATWARPGP